MNMITIINWDSKKAEGEFCWNEDWIREFESPWSIFEKFKFANALTTKEVLTIFGNKDVKNKRVISLALINCNLITMERLDSKHIKDVFGVDINQSIEYYQNVFKTIQNYNHRSPFRQELTICYKCMKKGYHSILHQLSLIHECPFHREKLLNICPKCRGTIPYQLLNDPKTEPYSCACGFSFHSSDTNLLSWKKFKPKIKSPTIKKWFDHYCNKG